MLIVALKKGEWIDVTLPDGQVGSVQILERSGEIVLGIDLPKEVLVYHCDIPIARRRGPLGYVPRDGHTGQKVSEK